MQAHTVCMVSAKRSLPPLLAEREISERGTAAKDGYIHHFVTAVSSSDIMYIQM